MDIRVGDSQLEQVLMSEKNLARSYGAELARFIARRVSEIRASRCVGDLRALLQTRMIYLDGERKGEIALTMGPTAQLVILPHSDRGVQNRDQDCNASEEITIVEVAIKSLTPIK